MPLAKRGKSMLRRNLRRKVKYHHALIRGFNEAIERGIEAGQRQRVVICIHGRREEEQKLTELLCHASNSR